MVLTRLGWGIRYGLAFLGVKLDDATEPYPSGSLVFGIGGAHYRAPGPPMLADGDAGRPRADGNSAVLRTERSRVKMGYTGSSIVRIATLQLAIEKTLVKLNAVKARTRACLDRRRKYDETKREVAQTKVAIRVLKAREKEQIAAMKREHAELREARLSVDKRAANLKSSWRALEDGRVNLNAMRTKHRNSCDLLRQAVKMVSIRQTRVILQLHSIFPLAQVSPSKFTICALELPDADYSGYDDEAIATAVGCVLLRVVTYSWQPRPLPPSPDNSF